MLGLKTHHLSPLPRPVWSVYLLSTRLDFIKEGQEVLKVSRGFAASCLGLPRSFLLGSHYCTAFPRP